MDIQKIKIFLIKFWVKLEKNDRVLILVLGISFLVRIAFLLYSPLRGWDETVYLNLGLDLSENPFFYSILNSGWNDYIPSTDFLYGWPNIGFRAPLLPYIISFFYLINFNFIISFIIPIFATLSVLLIYVLGKKLFNKRIGLYSAILFSLIPIHVYCSGKIWTDTLVVFFILLTFISFWEGYERENKKHKILFGFFLALSLMARYTTLWIIPVFPLYFIVRDRSLIFLRDKYLWYSILIFFITLIPLLIYGLNFYGNPLGALIHGFKASSYWGGMQSWSFFFENSWQIFSIVGVLFIFSFIYILIKKEFITRGVYFLLIWAIFFSLIVMSMPHKEERFILPIIPVICLISGFFVANLKKYRNLLFGLICVVLVFSLWKYYKTEYQISINKANQCFVEGNNYLAGNSINNNSLIITNQSPIVYYYTQKENRLYPDPWSVESLNQIIKSNYKDRKVYIYFSNYDMDMNNGIKNDLDNIYKKVFECSKGWGYSAVYKYE